MKSEQGVRSCGLRKCINQWAWNGVPVMLGGGGGLVEVDMMESGQVSR